MSDTLPEHLQPPPSKPQDFAFLGDWPGFFGAVRGKGARQTLITAAGKFDMPGIAVDLACGEGRDTLELLARGWSVHAIEPVAHGLAMLRDQTPPQHAAKLHVQQADFAGSHWPAQVDLVNCSFALPFCPADQFEGVWSRIAASIRPGGRFAGQFFGPRDTWCQLGRTIAHSRSTIDRLLTDFIMEELREEEKDDAGDLTCKHWHVFHIVARRR